MDISQAELAEKMGVSYQTINTWENNPPASFSAANLDRLSSILECKKTWLVEGYGRKEQKSEIEAKIEVDPSEEKMVGFQLSKIKDLEAKLDAKDETIKSQRETIETLKDRIAELKADKADPSEETG